MKTTKEEKGDVGFCEHCDSSFAYRLIHNGFNDSAYGYCDTCGKTCLLDGWKAPKGADLKIHAPIAKRIEPLLVLCDCGGSFKGSVSPRCPQCKETLSPIKAAKWIEANAPGTKKGWRWLTFPHSLGHWDVEFLRLA